MLRSYQYTEKSYLDYSMQSDIFQKKEIEYVRSFAERNPSIGYNNARCPMCGNDDCDNFFEKWGSQYLRCKSCKTVFVDCDESQIKSYLQYDELIEFRKSNEYQEQMKLSRNGVWKEFIEWLEVRTFRFLGKNKNLNIVDVGNRLKGFIDMINASDICGSYELRDSILNQGNKALNRENADIVLYNEAIKNEYSPEDKISEIRDMLKPDGLLVMGARAGSGFDILTLKEHNSKIVPYEHILLPSVIGMTIFLEKNGFEVLEITTPGVMDVKYVMDSIDELDESDLFVQELLSETSEAILQEFQRFLQKSCMSSLIRVIARQNERI